ncbi:hypothetical protein BG004_003917 [Podila humilis]|nr:hypothetical protein BG004_003917 [Podila humilis]
MVGDRGRRAGDEDDGACESLHMGFVVASISSDLIRDNSGVEIARGFDFEVFICRDGAGAGGRGGGGDDRDLDSFFTGRFPYHCAKSASNVDSISSPTTWVNNVDDDDDDEILASSSNFGPNAAGGRIVIPEKRSRPWTPAPPDTELLGLIRPSALERADRVFVGVVTNF